MKKTLFALILSLLFTSHSFAEGKENYSIVIIGDSITEGYGLEKKQAYPHLLNDLFKKDKMESIQILNAGISGSTSATALQRLKWFLKSKPDMVILALGANDGLRGVPTKTLEKNLSETIALAKENKIHGVLIGMMLPPNYGEAYRKEFQNVFKNVAKKYAVDFIPFLLDGIAGDKSYNQEDGIHPNEKGQVKIAAHLYKSLKPIVEKNFKIKNQTENKEKKL